MTTKNANPVEGTSPEKQHTQSKQPPSSVSESSAGQRRGTRNRKTADAGDGMMSWSVVSSLTRGKKWKSKPPSKDSSTNSSNTPSKQQDITETFPTVTGTEPAQFERIDESHDSTHGSALPDHVAPKIVPPSSMKVPDGKD